MWRIAQIAGLALIVAGWLHVPAAHADSMPVDLELVLAVDVSLSMDFEEQRLQRDGYVEAFRDPEGRTKFFREHLSEELQQRDLSK